MRGNTHVRFGGAGRGNGPSETTTPRPGPIPTDQDGNAVDLDTEHRRHAVVENAIRDLKYGVGLNHLPSGRFGANAAWLALNVMAHNLCRATARIGGIDIDHPSGQAPAPLDEPTGEAPAATSGPARKSFVATDTLRRRYLAVPGRLASSARRLTVHLPARWPWAERFTAMLANIRAVDLAT